MIRSETPDLSRSRVVVPCTWRGDCSMVGVVRAASACLLLIGCFYVDPFNNPPSIRPRCEFADGRQCSDDSVVTRGERIQLRMVVSDPDGNEDKSTYGWRAFACTEDDGTGCMSAPFDEQRYDEELPSGLELQIPLSLASDVRSTSIDFEARDDRGGIGLASMVFRLVRSP
jgi:hypothetical protein